MIYYSIPDNWIEMARNPTNSDKFISLYEKDDISDSYIDLALFNILSFWLQDDYEQINTIFRNSALFREK